MSTQSNFKNLVGIFFQGLGAIIAFIASMMIANFLSPMPKFILDKTPPMGFFSLPVALLFSGVFNGLIHL